MTNRLKAFADRFDRGMSLRRRMLGHIGAVAPADVSDRDVTRLEPAIRESLRACSSCDRMEACRVWLESGRPGIPPFCAGRSSLECLQTALSGRPSGATLH